MIIHYLFICSNSLSMDRARGRDKDRVISAASFPDDDPYQSSSRLNGNRQSAPADNGALSSLPIGTKNYTISCEENRLDSKTTDNFYMTSNYNQNQISTGLEPYQFNSEGYQPTTYKLKNQFTSSNCSLGSDDNGDVSSTRM